jgi:hypothetical protein
LKFSVYTVAAETGALRVKRLTRPIAAVAKYFMQIYIDVQRARMRRTNTVQLLRISTRHVPNSHPPHSLRAATLFHEVT